MKPLSPDCWSPPLSVPSGWPRRLLHQITLLGWSPGATPTDDFTLGIPAGKLAATVAGQAVTASVVNPGAGTEQAMAPSRLGPRRPGRHHGEANQVAGDDPLSLQFVVSNTGSRNVVRVNGSLTLFSADGVQPSEPVRFWVGENRLPDSYLRMGRHVPPAIELARPAGLTGSRWCGCRSTRWEFR